MNHIFRNWSRIFVCLWPLATEVRHLLRSVKLCSDVFRLRSSHDLQQEVDRLKSSVDSAVAERRAVEQVRRGVEDHLNTLTTAHVRLQTAYSELRRQREVMGDEKDELMKDLEQLQRDYDRWYYLAAVDHIIIIPGNNLRLIDH